MPEGRLTRTAYRPAPGELRSLRHLDPPAGTGTRAATGTGTA